MKNLLDKYYAIRDELNTFDKNLGEKEEWIILTKKDLVNQDLIDNACNALEKTEKRVLVVSENDPESIKKLSDTLVSYLREKYNDSQLEINPIDNEV